jgi:signal transduction histidine kinase
MAESSRPDAARQFLADLANERARLRREFKEAESLLDRLRAEQERAKQRHAATATRLTEVQAAPESYSHKQIADAFDQAKSAEVRSLLVSSQIEQFRFRQSTLGALAEKLVTLSAVLERLIANETPEDQALDAEEETRRHQPVVLSAELPRAAEPPEQDAEAATSSRRVPATPASVVTEAGHEELASTAEAPAADPNAGESAGPTLPDRTGERGPGIGELVAAREEERRRLSLAILDGPVQQITNIVLRAEMVERLLGRDEGRARRELERLSEMTTSSVAKIRRFTFDLYPPIIEEVGLVETVRRYAHLMASELFDLEVEVAGPERRLPSDVEVALFRVVQEGIENVLRHAGVTGARVSIRFGVLDVEVSVSDAGCGFDPSTLADSAGPALRGIAGLRTLLHTLRGELSVASERGSGTTLSAFCPV